MAHRKEVRIDESVRRLELPLFNGENPHRRIFKIEWYFQFNQIKQGRRACDGDRRMYGRNNSQLVPVWKH